MTHENELPLQKAPAADLRRSVAAWLRALDPFLLAVLAGQTALGLLLLPLYRYQINTDGVSYIAVSREYLAGHFMAAFNGYWSPLFSWLLMPLLALGMNPLIAGKLLNLAVGAVTLGAAWRMGERIGLGRTRLRWLALLFSPILLAWALAGPITPDLLLVASGLFFLTALLHPQASESSGRSFAAGLLAGVTYLSKSYGLPFAAVTLPGLLVWQGLVFRRPLRSTARSLCAGLLGLAILALPWAAALSVKYGRPTFGTTGRYAFAIQGPVEPDHPILTQGLFAPPNEFAQGPWEDPSYLPIHPWSPFSSGANLRHFEKLVHVNAIAVAGIVTDFSPLAFGLGATALVLALSRFCTEGRDRFPPLGFLAAIVVFILGYCLVYVEGRHIWIVSIGLLLAGLYVAENFARNKLLQNTALTVFLLLIGVSFDFSALVDLIRNIHRDRPLYQTSLLIPALTGKRTASNTDFGKSSCLASYYKGARYYGMLRPGENDSEARAELMRHQIEYFLYWGRSPLPGYLAQASPVAADDANELRLFRLAPAAD